MCVSSHHFPPTGQSAGHSKHEKHPFYRRPPAPPPPGLFLFLQSPWWTPRETVWHWWLLRASFPWVKYQAPVRPVSSSTHRHTNTHTNSKHAGKPSQRPRLQICILFYSRVFLFECQMDAMAHGKKESICIHTRDSWGAGETLLFAQCQVVYHLAGQGRSRRWEMAALSSGRVILFSVGTIYRHSVCLRGLWGESHLSGSVLFSFILPDFFFSCVFSPGHMADDYLN